MEGKIIQVRANPKRRFWLLPLRPIEAAAALACDRDEPSLREVLLMFGMTLAVHLLTTWRLRYPWEPPDIWFDRKQYLDAASMVRYWHFGGGPLPKVFMGLPYVIAGVSKVLSVPVPVALVIVSMLASLAVCILVHRLYGGWVAALFTFVNFHWIMLAVEGGTEPLFMCLVYASFLAARSSRWKFAALLASLGTTVRPVGIIALLSFAAVLAMRRSYRKLAAITLISLVVAVLYFVPLWRTLGNPFVNFTGYHADWGSGGWPLTYPFGALVPSYLSAFHEMRWTLFTYCAVWAVAATVGLVAICLPSGRRRLWQYPPEALFAWVYLLFYLMYNISDIAVSFDRYMLPGLPLLLFALRDMVPHDRRVLWAGAGLSALLASASAVGFRNVFGFKLP